MQRKRTAEEERNHLLHKIRRLEKRIYNLPEDNEIEEAEVEEGEIKDKDQEPSQEEDLFEGFLEDGNEEASYSEDSLDKSVLDILGLAPAPLPKKETLHKEIAERWSEILEKGLKKEEKETINKDNPPFANVHKMVAPKLNKEVASALTENAKKRDQLIENRQKQVSTALACVGRALQLCLGDIKEQKLQIIKKLNEAGRLLSDSIFIDSKGRRTLALASLNKDHKESLLETEIGEFLFGDNLTEKIKTAKAVQKSSKDLKADEKKKHFVKRTDLSDKKENNRPLNWRGPPRGGLQQRFQRSGGQSFSRPQIAKKTEDRMAPRKGKK